ncbi:MAG: porin, partial [Gammaproteobacteria bacterium]
MNKVHLSVAVLASALAFGAQAEPPSMEELWQIIQKQQQEIQRLKEKLESTEAKVEETEQKVEATGEMLEEAKPSAPAWTEKTSVGSYGEITYNNYREDDRDDVLDLKRFVLFLGYRFNERIRFQSELEVEHAFVEGGEESGEVAMEQAYVQVGLADRVNLRAGLQLIPLGILNETHEPTTFYGVERNEVETRIIPSTWRELALGLQGEALPGLEYNVGISSSLDASEFKDPSKGIRSMRQSGFKANANDLAFYGALNYRGVPGLLLGAGIFTGNTGQDNEAIGDARLTLWDVHGKYRFRDVELRALYARGTLDDAGNIAFVTGQTAPETFDGWYAEAAYHLWKRGERELVPFVRYAAYNT